MSQYSLPSKNPNHAVLVGWDPQLNTYFLHVIDKTKGEDDEERDVLDIGCTPHELEYLEVINPARAYAFVDKDIEDKLYNDMHE